MIEINIGLDSGELGKLLAKLSDRTLRAKIAHEAGNVLLNITKDSLRDATSPGDDTVWELEPATVKRKAQIGASSHPLEAFGNMKKIRLEKNGEVVTIALNAVSPKGVSYPAVHQFGTTRAGRNKNVVIPARPFLPITPDEDLMDIARERVTNIVRDIIEEVLG